MNEEQEEAMTAPTGSGSKYYIPGTNAQVTVIEEVFQSIVQDFQNKYLTDSSNPEAAKELRALLQLVKDSQALPADEKVDTIKAIGALGKEITAPQPNKVVVEGIFEKVKSVVSAAADIAEPAAKIVATVAPLLALI
jgi:hypothetical protein